MQATVTDSPGGREVFTPEQLEAARAAFLARVEAFCAAAGRSEGPVSTRLFGKHDRVDQIRSGSDIGVGRLARAMRDLAALEAEAGLAPAAA